ncbi:GGDEF domain-containing protein [Bacillus sp. FJAT-28004]|uniref:GGDEF domain-containing protein n=1 Tax=Bacillus sp. FJAT-28004 TaxID=1679165 RepID=UPI000A9AA851|nr:GGDEF domain-containing protein [Bacillus sp. FJAT-28004]
MKETLTYLPTFLTFGLMASLFGITFLLYLRWRTRNYLLLSLSSGSTAVIHLLLFAAAQTNIASDHLVILISGTSLILFIGIHASFFHFFLPKRKKELAFFAGAAGAAILSLALGFFNQELGAAALTVMNIAFINFFIFKILSQLPKKKMFLLSHIFFSVGFVIQTAMIIFHIPGALFFTTVLATASFGVMLLIFYDRIVDMVLAVSNSAVTDGLTGLYNKTYFIRKVNDYLSNNTARALIFIDIDNFKRLNDTQGHPMGDAILKLVAKIMQETFKETALIGRYGGEEMVAVITNDHADPEELAELFRSRVEELTPNIFPVTVSVGCSISEFGLTAAEFIKQADEAMYVAKSEGKNRVVLYQKELESND